MLSAVTGTENYIAYSPSCLFEGLNSAGQAALQVGFGLCTPCMATLVTLILWVIRYDRRTVTVRLSYPCDMAQGAMPTARGIGNGSPPGGSPPPPGVSYSWLL